MDTVKSPIISINLMYSILSQPDNNPKDVIKIFWSGGEDFDIPNQNQQELITAEIYSILEIKERLNALIYEKLKEKKLTLDKLLEAILLVGCYRILSNNYVIDRSFYKEFIKITSNLVSPNISGLVHAILESLYKNERI